MSSKVRELAIKLLLISLLVNFAMVNSVTGSSTTTVSIDPPVIWDLTMGPGAQFQVDIVVNYVESLWAYQFELGEALFDIPGWNPSVLHLISIENGPFLGSKGGRVVWYPGDIDNTKGTLTLSGAALDPKRRFPTGGGVLAILTFEVVGYGISPIHFGLDTALLNKTGGFELGPDWEPLRGTLNPDFLKDGFFCNVQGPELYIRTKGAKGGGVWPEWQVNLVGEPQTLYSRITNHGEWGAWVKVKFTVTSAAFGTQTYWSNEAWVDPFIGDIGPGTAVVSATFTPPGPTKYYVSGMLYFKVEGMSEYQPYQLVIEGGGQGEAFSRDIAEHYKVVTQM